MSSAWSRLRRNIGHRLQVSDYNIQTNSGVRALKQLSPSPSYDAGVPVIFASIKDKIHYYNSGDRSAPSMIKWANGLLGRAVKSIGGSSGVSRNRRRRARTFRKPGNTSKTGGSSTVRRHRVFKKIGK